VAQHLRAWNSYRGEPNRIYFWRTRGGAEVDFVVYGRDGFWAIEVKSSPRIHKRDLRSLRTFHSDYPESVPLLLYTGRERLVHEGITCVPCEEFLRELHPEHTIDDACFQN
jgi:predicted AAA+ superfamily ATPase